MFHANLHRSPAIRHGIIPCYKLLAFCHQRDTGRDRLGRSGSECDTGWFEARSNAAMYLAIKSLPEHPRIAVSCVDRDIRDFLAGKSDGEGLLHALYDHVLDEPVPERLRALLRP